MNPASAKMDLNRTAVPCDLWDAQQRRTPSERVVIIALVANCLPGQSYGPDSLNPARLPAERLLKRDRPRACQTPTRIGLPGSRRRAQSVQPPPWTYPLSG